MAEHRVLATVTNTSPSDCSSMSETRPAAARPYTYTLARGVKRALDLFIAFVMLVFLSPVFLACVILIRRDGGPAFYRHNRVGAGGRAFDCLKFRSMHVDADRILADLLAGDAAACTEWTATQKLHDDPRVTPIGQFLRQTSIDELPQIFNVVRGEMSLVGPRPVVPSELRFYGGQAGEYLRAKPGITGLWQVSGRSHTSYEQRVRLDICYLRNWTLWLDLVILAKTVPAVLLRRGAV